MSIKPFTTESIESLKKELQELSPVELLRWAHLNLNAPVFASSLGQEDQVITDLIARHELEIPMVTLDTGRLFAETYDLIAETERKYGLRIETLFPLTNEVEAYVQENGINGFRKGLEERKACCAVRKLAPLRRALARSDGWICGLRSAQSDARSAVQAIEWDAANGIPKLNPLHAWSLAQVKQYLAEHAVPYNPLHDAGFVSIGCASCTRAVEPGEDIRAGRWWWESPAKKECGLHFSDRKLVRAKHS